MDDPANRPFLEALGRGEAPRELLRSGQGEPIHVNCVRSNNDYTAPPKSVAFTGRGQTLSNQGMQCMNVSFETATCLVCTMSKERILSWEVEGWECTLCQVVQ